MLVVILTKWTAIVARAAPFKNICSTNAGCSVVQSINGLTESKITVRCAGNEINDEMRARRVYQPEVKWQVFGSSGRKIPSGNPKYSR